jgi:hypothetical protein
MELNDEKNKEQEQLEQDTKQIIFKPTIKKSKNIGPKKIYKKNKKRIVSETWNLPIEYLYFEKQWEMIQEIYQDQDQVPSINEKICKEKKTLLREVERKIYGYKHQDIEKNIYEPSEFLSFKNIIHQMMNCKMKCYYCECEMFLLYEKVLESKQWTVDRLDNYKGHNKDNFVLACLECNLKRRRRTSEKYLFTKQLQIVKKD